MMQLEGNKIRNERVKSNPPALRRNSFNVYRISWKILNTLTKKKRAGNRPARVEKTRQFWLGLFYLKVNLSL
jgi:hypothetical protein